MAVSLALDPEVQRQGLTRAQYDALVLQGAFDGMPIELLEGELVHMAPQGPPHSSGIHNLARALDRLLVAEHGEKYAVTQEKPFAASALSEPEPDIAVVDAASIRWGATDHPSRAHLIIEVSRSSRRIDLVHKPRIYAAAGVPQYWVVDLTRRRTVVHQNLATDPGADVGYESVTTHRFEDALPILGVSMTIAEILS